MVINAIEDRLWWALVDVHVFYTTAEQLVTYDDYGGIIAESYKSYGQCIIEPLIEDLEWEFVVK